MDKRLARPSTFYGWYMVIVAGLAVFFSGPGQTYFISVFIDHYIIDFGWTRSEVSIIYSAATLTSAACLFFIGHLVDRLGQRKMLTVASILLALACFYNGFVGSLMMLFWGVLFLRLFGQGSMTLIPNTLVPQWFLVKRGQALSYMAIGGFISAAAFPPMNVWLIQRVGWERTWWLWGIMILIIFTPIAYRYVRNRPEDIGVLPDGHVKAHDLEKPDMKIQLKQDFTLNEALRTRAFWLILSCIGIPALVNTAITFHLISIFNQKGLDASMAALVLSLMAIIGFPITFIAGRIIDTVKINYVLAGIFITEIIFMGLLQLTTTPILAIGFGIIWGISNGFERIALNYVWPFYFGRVALGSISGIATSVMVLGSAIGPLPFGLAFDAVGNYTEVIWWSMILPVIGIIASLSAKKPSIHRNSRLKDE